MARASCNPIPILALALALTSTLAAAQTMNHGAMSAQSSSTAPAGADQPPSLGQTLLERVRSLEGKWDAQPLSLHGP